jgi:hypothetical protein
MGRFLHLLPALGILGAIASSPAAIAQPQATFIRPAMACPTDLETLTPLLLRDLPSYANRTSQRAASLIRNDFTSSYVLVAEVPDFAPLTLGPGQYNPTHSETEPSQFFFVTLERQYSGTEVRLLEHYHWLFLTQTPSGWRFVMMFSRLAHYPDGQPITPPRDTSYGVLAEATRQWLRDCRTENIAPPDERG